MRTRALAPLLMLLLAFLVASPAAGWSGRKLALGVTMYNGQSAQTYVDFVSSLGGHAPAIWNVHVTWGVAENGFPGQALLDALDPDTSLMITWSPYDPTRETKPLYTYRKIINGRHDAYIRAFAEAARDSDTSVILRPFHEMDGFWFPWSVTWFDNTPKRFKAAWRHVHGIFKDVGATNVRFLFSPNQPCGQCVSHAKLYPGDKYVDYVGFTAFNWSGKYRWLSMVQTLQRGVTGMMKLTKKPIIVSETGSFHRGGDKVAWIAKGYPAVFKKWPRVKGVVYFNVNAKALDPAQTNWLLTKPMAAFEAYRTLAAKAKFQGTLP